jgi:starvation-inducible DNA-binding protein
MKPEIGISEKNLHKSVIQLSSLLSNEMMLYVKTRKFHWNVSGESFMELHKLYESQYKQIEESIDEIAERIGKLGENTIGTMKEFTEFATIKEHAGTYTNSKDSLGELLSDHQIVIVELRKNIEDSAEKNKDAGTVDFLTGLLEQHETMAWILRRYLN